jgi:hypothetical protein
MITLYDGEEGWLAYSYNNETKLYFMHMTFKGKWNKKSYKELLNIFTDACIYLESKGIYDFYSACYGEKQIKFNELFGFTKLTKIVDDNGDEVTIMRFDNVWE